MTEHRHNVAGEAHTRMAPLLVRHDASSTVEVDSTVPLPFLTVAQPIFPTGAFQKCNRCKRKRSLANFLDKNGRLRKTCPEHSTRKGVPDFTSWKPWAEDVLEWKELNDTDVLDRTELNFDLDDLPVQFPPSDNLSTNAAKKAWDAQVRTLLDKLMGHIYTIGGYKWIHTHQSTNPNVVTSIYKCAQSNIFAPANRGYGKSENTKRYDGHSMDRYPCQGSISVTVDRERRFLRLKISHKHHEPYESIALTPELETFIDERVLCMTSADIHKLIIQDSRPEWRRVAPHRVYYRWKKANNCL